MSTDTAHTVPVTTYTDIRHTAPQKLKDESDFRVFVEVEHKTIIVAYKKTMRAAQMASNRIDREHEYTPGFSWGWEARDYFNKAIW